MRNSELCAPNLRLAFLGLIWCFCWYRTLISLTKCLSPTSELSARQRWLTRPFVLVCSQWETLLEGIVFNRHSQALGSSCVLCESVAVVWVQVCQVKVLRLGNSSYRCAWSFALMAGKGLVTGRGFSGWWGPTRTSKVLELLDIFINDVGKMGVKLVVVVLSYSGSLHF